MGWKTLAPGNDGKAAWREGKAAPLRMEGAPPWIDFGVMPLPGASASAIPAAFSYAKYSLLRFAQALEHMP